MITKDNFKEVLESLGFKSNQKQEVYTKKLFKQYEIKADFKVQKLIYPKGIKIHDTTTSNFSHPENFVVFECVHRLLEKGYKANHLELEPRWQLGRGASGGKADILVRDEQNNAYLIIECKTNEAKNSEFKKEWNKMQNDGGQLISYFQQEKSTKFLCLYTSDFDGQKVIYENYILNMQDNNEYLKKNGFKESYKNANSVEEAYKVWNEIYRLDSAQIGIFERNINAYEIGQNALCFDDLKELESIKDENNKHEDGKYNEFAKILRKYNISGKENAFDKLVNLFLCKIYDETHNKDNLNFVYRGVVADSFESMQDRLMILYKNAMKEFLQEDITFIADSDIENAFKSKSKSKDTMKSLESEMKNFIKILKFYSNNDFAFLEVHNESLFYQNALVLVAVVKLFENLKLTQNKTNQFLGNLFELFLQKGMKQDEGQFFTPIQICEFIIYSLPLEQILKDRIPKVLDFACGAGHFLNTYANFLRSFQKENLKAPLNTYYSQITGIEKEYRLSKVAKVSSAMYGQNEINIIYSDALASNELDSKLSSDFDILIANPPYSVQGFLETLSDISRQSYKLFTSNINLDTNNNIECFFIERANQILADNAKVGIILPNSLLDKSGIYERAREILLQNFDIISIVELNDKTFGATGTHTIILFLSKKATFKHDKNYSQIYKELYDRLETQYLNDNSDFIENGFLESYCEFQGYEMASFKSLLDSKILDENLAQNDNFKEYKSTFLQSSEHKNLKKSKAYKEADNKEQIEQDSFIDFVIKREKEKLLYFSLSRNQEVLIIKSPSDDKEKKQFLGYEWSNRKGNEGIKEINIPYTTPLFNRENPDDENKINFLIRKSFLGLDFEIPSELEKFAFKANLVDLIDFQKVDFNKAISLSLKNGVANNIISLFENSKFELTRLESCILELQTAKRPEGGVGNYTSGALSLGGEHIDNISGYIKLDSPKYVPMEFYEQFKIQNKGIVKKNDILICKDGALSGKVALVRDEFVNQNVMINEHIFLVRCNNNQMKQKYLFFILHSNLGQQLLKSIVTGSAQGGINQTNLKSIKIPLPPLDIQKQIIAECEKIEEQFKTIRMSIEEYQNLIKAILEKCGVIANGGGELELDSIFVVLQELEFSIQSSFQSETTYSTASLRKSAGLEAIQNKEIATNAVHYHNDNKLDSNFLESLKDLINSLPTPPKNGWESVKLGDISSLEYGKALPENQRVKGQYPVMGSNGIVGYHNDYLVEFPTIIVGRKGSAGKITYVDTNCYPIDTTFYVVTQKYNIKLLFYALKDLNLEQRQIGIGVPGINRNDIYNLKISFPPIESQEKIVSVIEKIESKITQHKEKLESLNSKKEEILRSYLCN